MTSDMRQHPRFRVENTVYIELVSPEFGSNESGTIARCKTLEISRDGLRVELDRELPVSAILQLAVELPADGGTLYLVGEVSWSQPTPGNGAEQGWSAGLALFNADDSDIDDWVALVATMES